MQLGRLAFFARIAIVAVAVAVPRFALAQETQDASPPATPTPPPENARTDAPAKPEATATPAAPGIVTEPAPSNSIDGRVIVEIAGYHDDNAVSVLTPSIGARLSNPTAGWNANGRYLVDVVSAASPDIVSTASPHWVEVRHAGNIGAQYKPGDFGVGIGGGTSYTPDYLALNGNAQITQDLFQKNTTLVGGYGFGHDVIGRVGTPWSVFSRKLDYHSINAGISQVLNPSMVLGIYADVIIERGDQSKPYRYIPMFDAKTANDSRLGAGASPADVAKLRLDAKPLEQLPLERERAALTARLAWRFSHSTLRLEERGYGDTWGLFSSTTDVRYFIDLSERVMVWPHLRANFQNGVSFYRRTYVATGANDLPALRTGDRELSPLMSGTAGGGIRFGLGRAGRVDDFVLQATIDGVYTNFNDALFVKSRIAGLAATTLEVAF